MFELLMLAGFLYAGLIHLRPQESKGSQEEGEEPAHREIQPHPRLRTPGRKTVRSASLGRVVKTRRLC